MKVVSLCTSYHQASEVFPFILLFFTLNRLLSGNAQTCIPHGIHTYTAHTHAHTHFITSSRHRDGSTQPQHPAGSGQI
ncbi:hypothetical protein F5X96DRAFT_619902 [Biscogniauxia mediterranea]|nr:hypothetical protein F5X96DRAFT_619902 [Biscogniauxia mediterranea]